MKAIIGADGSAGALAAAQFAGRILSAEKDEAYLYYSPPEIAVRAGRRPDYEAMERIRRQLCDGVLEASRQRLPEGLRERAETILGTQKPAHGLLVAADEQRAELIVIGSRGAGSAPETALGSVARNVVHHATIPVLVVRRSAWESQDRPLRVLLASDGSPSSHHTCQALHGFTWPEGTIGQALTVAEPSLSGQIPEWLEDQLHQNEIEALGIGDFTRSEEERRLAQEELRQWCGPLPPIFAGQDPLVTVGRASDEILRVVKSRQFDLVVVGSHTGTLGRLLLGGTSQRVLTHAPCSVLIVRRHEAP